MYTYLFVEGLLVIHQEPKTRNIPEEYAKAVARMNNIPQEKWSLWWLSFVDPDKPKGNQFLGACIIKAPCFTSAVILSTQYCCNPGGEVKVIEFPKRLAELVASTWTNRLLTREDIARFDAESASWGLNASHKS